MSMGLGLGLRLSTSLSSGLGPVVETSWSFYDNFNSYADQTFLVPGGPTPALDWSAWSSVSATTNEKYNAVVASATHDIRTRTSGSVADFTTNGVYMIGRSIGTVDHFATVTWGIVSANRKFFVGATDEGNKMEIDGNGNNTVNRVIAGTRTSLGATPSGVSNNRDGGVRNMIAGDRMDFAVWNGNLYIRKNGLTVRSALSLSTLTGVRFGFPSSNDGYRSADNVGATPLSYRLTLTALEPDYPRIQGLGNYADGAQDIAISGTWECKTDTPPTGLHWRLIDFEFGDATGYVWKDWAWVTSPTIGAGSLSGGVYSGTWSATIRVPCGLAGVRPYVLQVRTKDDTFALVASGAFTVSYRVLGVGQSNIALASSTNSTGITDHPGGFEYKPPDPPTLTVGTKRRLTNWYSSQAESSTNEINIGRMTELLSAGLDLPVSFLNLGISATGSTNVGPSGTNATWLTTHNTLAGAAFDCIVVSHGEQAFNSASEGSNWKSIWRDTNIPGFRAMSGQPVGTTIPVIFAITGRYDGVLGGADDAATNTMRQAQADIVSELSDAYVGYHHLGITFASGDAYHYETTTANGYYKIMRRLGLTLRKLLGGGAYDGRGPYATGVTRSGANLTVAVNLNGADSIAGTTLTSWLVSTSSDFSTGNQTITSCDVSGSNVAIVLASDPGAPVYVRNYSGVNPTVSSWVIGTYADASTIEMEPIVKPLLSN